MTPPSDPAPCTVPEVPLPQVGVSCLRTNHSHGLKVWLHDARDRMLVDSRPCKARGLNFH